MTTERKHNDSLSDSILGVAGVHRKKKQPSIPQTVDGPVEKTQVQLISQPDMFN